MSAPASVPTKVTAGYAVIPNSIIENQVNLTRAELALALIVLRRGGASDPITVSDRNWESWTGLSARNKEYAISGLKAKGLEVVEGRGDQARFRWARNTWEHYVKHTERTKPRTNGRAIQSVPAKPGAHVHPSCRDTGCAMLSCTPSGTHENGKGLSLVPATSITQPVAQVVTAAWAQTLEAVRQFFPLVGVAFLVRLVAMVRALFLDVDDTELAAAVKYAYFQKAAFQKSEGLFLFTVPEAIAALRKLPPKKAPPPAEDRYAPRAIIAMIRRVGGSLGASGPVFQKHARALDNLAARLEASGERLEMEALDALETDLEARQAAIAKTAIDTLSSSETVKISQSVELQLAPYSKMTADQRARLRRQFMEAETLQALAIPRLGMLYT